MRIALHMPRLLPITIVTMAALLSVKSISLVRAASAEAASAPPAASDDPAKASSRPADAEHGGAPAAQAKPDAGKASAETAPALAAGARSAPPTPPMSDSERSLLFDLKQRSREIESREQAVRAREEIVAAAERRLATRVDELTALQGRLQALEAARKEHDEANWRGLVKLYEGMKPRDAAAIFNDLDLAVLLPVVDRMKEAKAALVLAAMQPDRARKVTTELAQMRAKANTPAPAGEKHG